MCSGQIRILVRYVFGCFGKIRIRIQVFWSDPDLDALVISKVFWDRSESGYFGEIRIRLFGQIRVLVRTGYWCAGQIRIWMFWADPGLGVLLRSGSGCFGKIRIRYFEKV